MIIFNRRLGRITSKKCKMYGVLAGAMFLIGRVCSAEAFDIPTGNEDVQIRWDNTLRYSYAARVANQNQQLLANPNMDDGDRNFSHGTVGDRIDILSELDVVYKKDFGVRASGAGWYDFAYDGNFTNTNTATSNHMVNGLPVAGGLNSEAKKWYLGPNGELLDAFTFGKFTIGDIPVTYKVGRHTVYWGESLLFGGAIHGVSYGQAPLDIAKALVMPGTEAKELFRPLNQISVQVQPTKDLTIMGQYFLEWDSFRFPEAGTYLGAYDFLQRSSESLITGPGQRAIRSSDSEPSPFNNWGVAVRYSPDWLDGTLGLYYRKFADMQPQVAVRPTAATLPAAAGTALGYTRLAAPGTTPAPYAFSAASIPDISAGRVGNFYQTYGENIQLVGASFSKQFLGVSTGAELSYRWNMPLVSKPVMILPTPLVSSVPGSVNYVPTDGQTPGARGNTWHGVLNFLGTLQLAPLFDGSNWIVEFVWNRLDRVTQNKAALKSGDSGYTGIDAVTKDFFGAGVSFTPVWYQALAGLDVTMPLSYSRGLSGNSVVSGGGNHDSGTWSAGLGFDLFTQYKFDLKYINFFGPIDASNNPNGFATAALKDRDMVTFTCSTKF